MPDVTGEQRGRAFDDPALVDEVEALQQPVVRHLPLELRERPAARGGEIPELVGESPAEGARATVRTTAGHQHRDPAWGRAGGFPSFSEERSACTLASSIHWDASGSPVVSRSQRKSARPSPA
jgi:hypothetical protein